jgi:hypothetical protein
MSRLDGETPHLFGRGTLRCVCFSLVQLARDLLVSSCKECWDVGVGLCLHCGEAVCKESIAESFFALVVTGVGNESHFDKKEKRKKEEGLSFRTQSKRD